MIDRLPAVIAGPLREVLGSNWVDVVLRLSILLVMLYFTNNPQLRVVLRVIGVAMLLSPMLLRSTVAWLAVSTMVCATVGLDWYAADNHYWLIGYWTIVCTLAVAHGDDRGALRIMQLNGRLLIGLCMLFAAIWKVIGWQYHDGNFFLYTFHFDSRFKRIPKMVGSPDEYYGRNRASYNELSGDPREGYATEEQLEEVMDAQERAGKKRERPRPGKPIEHSKELETLALAFSWWTIFIEAAIAFVFLCPFPRWLFAWRDWVLISFIVTTYLLAPVFGFGMLLFVMGLAQTDPQRWGDRVGYFMAMAAMHIGNPFAAHIYDRFLN